MPAFFIRPGQVLLRAPGQALLSSALGVAAGGGTTSGTGTAGGSSGGGSQIADAAVLVAGQSNALATFSAPSDYEVANIPAAGLSPTAAAGLQFFLRSATAEIDFSGGQTANQGHGLYQPGPNGLPGDMLLNPNGDVDSAADPGTWTPPSAWTWGTSDGASFEAYLNGLSSSQVSACSGMWIYWYETDLGRAYAEKATFSAALLQFIALTRAKLGKTAANFPIFTWFPIPSTGGGQGMMMIAEVVYELAANAANNFWIVLPQTADCNPRGATVNADGTWSGGTWDHENNADYARWVRRAMLPIARAILASNGVRDLIPSALGTGLGPKIVAAQLGASGYAANTVLVTIQHDTGTDLILPGQASTGIGWVLEDGHTSGLLPGNQMNAIACQRIDATHLLVTFPGLPANQAGACRLHYPYPYFSLASNRGAETVIGAGNCVTDNAASIAKPSGWDIAASSGDSTWDQNMPLQSPVIVNNGTATCGIPCASSSAATIGPYLIDNLWITNGPTYQPGGQVQFILDDGTDIGYSKPAAMRIGTTTSLAELPSSYVTAGFSNYQSSDWSSYDLTAPSSAGTFYVVAEALDAKGNPLARTTSSGFTVI